MIMDDEEWQDGMDEDFEATHSEYSEVSDEEVERQMAQYLSEEEQDDRLEDLNHMVSMITERRYIQAIKKLHAEEGDAGVMELIFALERVTGWHMEIVACKSDVEDALFNWYGVYDVKAWEKAKNTASWERTCYDVNFVARRGLGEMVREVAGDRSHDAKSALRRILFSWWKTIDMKLS